MSVECIEKSSSISDSFHEQVSSNLRWGISNIAKIVGVAVLILLFTENRADLPNKAEAMEDIKSLGRMGIWVILVTWLFRMIGDIFIYARRGGCPQALHKINLVQSR